jgi:predicted outer membrane repeat protein
MKRLLLAVVLAGLAPGAWASGIAPAHADQLIVCPSGCPYDSIRAAIQAASAGDTILIQPGTYTEHVALTKNLTLSGQNAVIDGGGATVNRSVIIVERGITATIRGLTITNGHSPDFGGGILNEGRLTLQQTQVTDNTATGGGGGIYNNGGMTLEDSQVINNATAGSGGGISNDNGTVALTNSPVQNNVPENCTGTESVPGCPG